MPSQQAPASRSNSSSPFQFHYIGPVIAAALVLIIFLSSTIDFSTFSSPIPPITVTNYTSTPSSYVASPPFESERVYTAVDTVGNRPEENFVDLLDAFRRWDDEFGCPMFLNKFKDWKPNASAVQDPEQPPCDAMKLSHVTVFVKMVTWIPVHLDGIYPCRCGLTCVWSRNRVLADKPDVDFYELFPPPPTRNRGEPLRAYLDIEPARKRTGNEDIMLSYHAGDDVQVAYGATKHFRIARSYHLSGKKRDDVLLYFSSSRCVGHRDETARKIMSLLPVHSFGKCGNNVGGHDAGLEMYPECAYNASGKPHWQEYIQCVMSHYKFVLAIENTYTDSYTSEKLHDPLESGAVPIFFGAADVQHLVPPNSIIEASKFASLEDLAEYVKSVAADPVAYAEFHAWRRCGLWGNYGRYQLDSIDHMPCRVCEFAATKGGRNAPNVTSPSLH